MYSDRALVIGAGFAGLLAARALSESYGDVVLVERDRLTPDTGHRPGVPQAHHPHVLLARGAEVLDELFPRFRADLEDAGAVRADVGSDHLVRFPSGWAPRDHLGLSVLSATRVTIEQVVRKRVLKLPNVSLVDGVTVQGLLTDRGLVTGVHGTRDGRPFTDYADLVVDASGQAGKLVSWLAEHGVHCPAPLIVTGHAACASRLYHVTSDLGLDWRTAREFTRAPSPRRGAAVSEVDGYRWFVTLVGTDGDTTPADEDGFAEHAAALECHDIAEIVKTAVPASPVHRSGALRSRWNRFHQVPRWPRGLLAVGDSVISLNPVHGHGMTLAALHAADLRHLLQSHDLAKEPLVFQRAVARSARLPWSAVTTADRAWSNRKTTTRTRARRWYAQRLADAVPGNARVYRAYVRVAQLADHPSALLAPRVLWHVLSGSRPRATAR
ncbi:tryptophan 7-halogenase [Lentzea fradiae]|nr:tryptophan 7-halogenase [Lentzea fradiae]